MNDTTVYKWTSKSMVHQDIAADLSSDRTHVVLIHCLVKYCLYTSKTKPSVYRPWKFTYYDGFRILILNIYYNSSLPQKATHIYGLLRQMLGKCWFIVELQQVSDTHTQPWYTLYLQEPNQTKKWRIDAIPGLEARRLHLSFLIRFKSVYAAL